MPGPSGAGQAPPAFSCTLGQSGGLQQVLSVLAACFGEVACLEVTPRGLGIRSTDPALSSILVRRAACGRAGDSPGLMTVAASDSSLGWRLCLPPAWALNTRCAVLCLLLLSWRLSCFQTPA